MYLKLGKWRLRDQRNLGYLEEADKVRFWVLILEPTGVTNVHFGEHVEYRRTGVTEFPIKDKFTGNGWIKQKVAII